MDVKNQEVELDLKELIYIIRGRLWFIVLVTILAVCSSSVVSFFILKPVYKASTTIMVARPSDYQKVINCKYKI